MSKRAIIVVDLQKDYLSSGSFALTGIDAAAANAARIVEAGRGKGDRIIHVHHIAKEASSPLFAPGTDGIQPIPAVAPREDDTVIIKNYPNSFRETALHQTRSTSASARLSWPTPAPRGTRPSVVRSFRPRRSTPPSCRRSNSATARSPRLPTSWHNLESGHLRPAGVASGGSPSFPCHATMVSLPA